MRRQLKPFVTEYRGTSRRGKDLAPESQNEPTRQRAFEEAQRVFHPDPGEDSYEAALRAADALFARAPQPAPSATAPPVSTIIEPATSGSVETDGRPSPIASDAVGVTATPALDFKTDEIAVAKIATEPPRRILQAIEPPEEDRFAALEAERAPKRRGRKPGSKNKPKIVVGDDWAAAVTQPRARSAAVTAYEDRANDTAVRLALVHAASVANSAEPDLDEDELLAADEPGDNPEIGAAESQPRGRNDKFSRKRVGLRPGERWKRRLPKSAW